MAKEDILTIGDVVDNIVYKPEKTFKTVDELFEYYHNNVIISMPVLDYIIYHCDYALLKTLKSKTNKPSKHDLEIINLICQVIDSDPLTNWEDILKVYKKRKV